MAIDTRSRRAAAISVTCVALTLPLADGTVQQRDRQSVTFTYSGTMAIAAVPVPTLAGLLAASSAEVVILAELTPLYVLSGCASEAGAGFPNTYSIALPRFVQTTRFRGGVYRRVTGVRENATTLTAQASAAAVNAAAGSWWWDEAAEKLYIRTTGTVNPDTLTAVAAAVTFYFATSGVVINRIDGDGATGIYYQPWLTGELPTRRDEVEDLLFGVKLQAIGSVSFTNTHGFFHTVVATNSLYVWKNTLARFFAWGRYNGMELLRSQAAAIATMEVDTIVSSEESASFSLKPRARDLDLEVPVTPIFESSYPNLGDGVRGTRKWIGYGRATITPDLVDTTGLGVYLCADAAYQTLFAVHAVVAIDRATQVRTTLAETTHYVVDLTACTVTIIAAPYGWQDVDLEIDLTGKPDGAGSYLKTGPAIIKDCLTTFLGATPSEIDAAAFTQAAIDAPEECAVWLKEQHSLSSILSNAGRDSPALERSSMATVRQTLAGLWTIFIWKPDLGLATAIAMNRTDFAKFTPVPKLQTVFSRVRVYYGLNQATGAWQVEESYDQRTEFLTKSKDSLDVYSFLIRAGDAQRLAQRIRVISAAISTEIDFEERGSKLALSLAADRVLLTFDPAPHAEDGMYSSEPMEIVMLETRLSPKVTVAGRFGDLRGIGKTIGHWADAAAPNYASSNADQRATQGYWADADGFIVPGDASTKNISRWW